MTPQEKGERARAAHQKRVEVQVKKFNRWLRAQNSTLVYDYDHPKRKQLITPMVNCVFKIRKVNLAALEKLADEEQITLSRYLRNITNKWIEFKKMKKLKKQNVD